MNHRLRCVVSAPKNRRRSRSTTRVLLAVALAGTSAATTLGVATDSATATVANGNLALTGGASGQPNDVQMYGADSAGIIYSLAGPSGLAPTSYYLISTAGKTTSLPSSYGLQNRFRPGPRTLLGQWPAHMRDQTPARLRTQRLTGRYTARPRWQRHQRSSERVQTDTSIH
jgi:hypothetical protein